MENENNYNIKAACNITGLNEHTIRAWEKRYSAVSPQRTDTNRRIYSENDIQKLLLMKQAVAKGHSVGSIANYSIEKLSNLLGKHSHETVVENEFEKYIADGIRSIKVFDRNSFEKVLNECVINYSKPVLLVKIIIPLLERIGKLWETGELRVIHEHFASSTLRTFLGGMLDNNITFENSPKLIATTPEGFLHELGALIYALHAMDFGWDAMFLGPNLPAEEIVAAVKSNDAQALLLSLVYPKDEPRFANQLKKLRISLGKSYPIIICGQAAPSYSKFISESNSYLINELDSLGGLLDSFRTIK